MTGLAREGGSHGRTVGSPLESGVVDLEFNQRIQLPDKRAAETRSDVWSDAFPIVLRGGWVVAVAGRL